VQKTFLTFAVVWLTIASCQAGIVMNTNDVGVGSLRGALANAAAGEIIRFDASLAGKRIELTSEQLTLTRDVVIDASMLSNPVTVAFRFAPDFDLEPEFWHWQRVFAIDPGVTAVMNGIAITMGYLHHEQGSGIRNLGNLTLTNCVVADNASVISDAPAGAGIWNGQGAKLTAVSTTISGNYGDGGFGGGLGNERGGIVLLANCTLEHNYVDGSKGNGGGIYNQAGGFVSLLNCVVNNNSSFMQGGGVFNASGGIMWIDGCQFSANRGEQNGGAIFNDGSGGTPGTIRIRRSTLSGNDAFQGSGIYNNGAIEMSSSIVRSGGARYVNSGVTEGGGLFNSNGTVRIEKCVFSGNIAGYGGGIYSVGGRVDISGSTLMGNVADMTYGTGGAIYSQRAILTLMNSTLTGNAAFGHRSGSPDTGYYYGFDADGSAIFRRDGALSIESCTITRNTNGDHTPDGVAVDSDGAEAITLNNSIVAGNFAPGSLKNLRGAFIGSNNLTAGDPMLGTLGDYGGPTPTVPLLPGSPAIDAAGATTLATDQRGFPRVAGSAPDIGAIEFGSVLPAPPRLTSVLRKPDGSVELKFEADPTLKFTVVATSDLTARPEDWSPLGVAEHQGSAFLFTDPAGEATQRYYSVRFP